MNEQEQTITELQIQIVGLECRINQNPAGQELRNELKTLRFQKNNLYLKWLVGEYNTSRQSYVGLKFQNTEPNPELKQVKGEDESSLSNLIERLNVLSHNISNTQLSIKKAEENISNPELTTRELSERLLTSQGIPSFHTTAHQNVLPPAKNPIPFVESEKYVGCAPFGNIFSPEFNGANNGYTLFDLRLFRKVITDIVGNVSENISTTFASSSMKSVRTSRLTSSNIASVRIPRQSTGVVRELYTATGLDTSTTERDYQQQMVIQRASILEKAKKVIAQRVRTAKKKAKKNSK